MVNKITTLRITKSTHQLFMQYAKTHASYGDTADNVLNNLLQKHLQTQVPQHADKNEKNVKGPAAANRETLTLTTPQTGGVCTKQEVFSDDYNN